MAAPTFPRLRKLARNAQKMITPLIWSGSVKKLEYVPMYRPSSSRSGSSSPPRRRGAGGSSSRDARGTEIERRRREDDVRGAETRTETREDEAETRAARETRRAARDGVAVVGRTTARVGAVISIVSLAEVRRGLCARGDPTRASPR